MVHEQGAVAKDGHDLLGLLQEADVGEWIAVHDENVGPAVWLQDTTLVAQAKRFCGVAGADLRGIFRCLGRPSDGSLSSIVRGRTGIVRRHSPHGASQVVRY